MDQITIQNSWQSTCSSVRHSAEHMAQMSLPEFGQLLLNVAEKFCSQEPPTTKEQLDFRQMQRTSLPNIIGAISHNDSMARRVPAATQELYDLAKEISERPLPRTKEECQQVANERLANTGRTSLICNKY